MKKHGVSRRDFLRSGALAASAGGLTAAVASATELAILEAIESGVCFPADLEHALSLAAGEVSHSVLLLTLRGLVENRAGVLVRVQR